LHLHITLLRWQHLVLHIHWMLHNLWLLLPLHLLLQQLLRMLLLMLRLLRWKLLGWMLRLLLHLRQLPQLWRNILHNGLTCGVNKKTAIRPAQLHPVQWQCSYNLQSRIHFGSIYDIRADRTAWHHRHVRATTKIIHGTFAKSTTHIVKHAISTSFSAILSLATFASSILATTASTTSSLSTATEHVHAIHTQAHVVKTTASFATASTSIHQPYATQLSRHMARPSHLARHVCPHGASETQTIWKTIYAHHGSTTASTTSAFLAPTTFLSTFITRHRHSQRWVNQRA
jgi:hypothetical protein